MLKKRLHTQKAFMEQQEANPLESVANLVDLMLVFACGLMMAIVMFWSIDLDRVNESSKDAYENIGAVYEDPDTGKIYIIEEGD